MPTYEYKCQKCSNEFEEFQSMTVEAKADCPKCGGHAKRMISLNSGIIFKGKGFYVTDYKNNKNANNNNKENKSCPNAETCADSKCPAAKTK
ncbi:FmdB family zinc ribbon protein [uncultured Brachyspira sp.]|uniref:FmdB family zinc ribbon protein n=1 Tax=uncultured Brachyspira sp. TaxID=221953 RepID=UPI002584EF22|nr:FmdB family zinc ribbon protein [uncultured Brachyspira sp.]